MRLNKDNSEILSYDTAGIPIYIREAYLSYYPNHRAICHWHEDIEFIYIAEGKMDYFVNGENIVLQKGDSLMINSGRLHYGFSSTDSECLFQCVILHPSLISSNKKLYQKFVESVISSSEPDYLLFGADSEISALLPRFLGYKKSPSASYELDVIGLFHTLWKQIYHIITTRSAHTEADINPDLLAQRQMVSFIYQNYASNITLDEIAAAGSVCRNKCCQIFKLYVGQSPIDFVNSYRLEHSQHLLLTTTLNITEICLTCGFNHLSYFSKQFQLKYGCTPRDYRKQYLPQSLH